MHKEEASLGFKHLSNPHNVKIVKMLYVKGDLNVSALMEKIEIEEDELKGLLNELVEGNLITTTDNINYSVNKDYVDTLMSFVSTKCKCTK